MEEKSIRIYDSEKTFFSKITSTISKLLIPTKIGINGMIISIKRNNILKAVYRKDIPPFLIKQYIFIHRAFLQL